MYGVNGERHGHGQLDLSLTLDLQFATHDILLLVHRLPAVIAVDPRGQWKSTAHGGQAGVPAQVPVILLQLEVIAARGILVAILIHILHLLHCGERVFYFYFCERLSKNHAQSGFQSEFNYFVDK